MKISPLLPALVVALLLATGLRTSAAQPLPRSAPAAQGISSQAVREFVEALDQINTMHSQDVVVAMTAGSANMQAELNAIWEKLLPAFQSEALPADAAGQEKVKQVIATLEVRPAKPEK